MAELQMSTPSALSASSGISSTRGTALSAPGGANSKGSYTQLVSSTAAAASGIFVSLYCRNASAVQKGVVLVDIAVGAASSEVVILPNLSVGCEAYATYCSTGCVTYFFPVSIPASTRISARYQAKATTTSCYVTVSLVGGSAGIINGHGTVEAWGVDTTNSAGTILDPGGTAHTKGNYVQLVASTARATRELSISLYNPDNDAAGHDQVEKAWAVDLAIGGAGSEYVIVPDIQASRGWSLCFSPSGSIRLPLSIPSGTRVSARAACTSTVSTDAENRQIGITAYGIG